MYSLHVEDPAFDAIAFDTGFLGTTVRLSRCWHRDQLTILESLPTDFSHVILPALEVVSGIGDRSCYRAKRALTSQFKAKNFSRLVLFPSENGISLFLSDIRKYFEEVRDWELVGQGVKQSLNRDAAAREVDGPTQIVDTLIQPLGTTSIIDLIVTSGTIKHRLSLYVIDGECCVTSVSVVDAGG